MTLVVLCKSSNLRARVDLKLCKVFHDYRRLFYDHHWIQQNNFEAKALKWSRVEWVENALVVGCENFNLSHVVNVENQTFNEPKHFLKLAFISKRLFHLQPSILSLPPKSSSGVAIVHKLQHWESKKITCLDARWKYILIVVSSIFWIFPAPVVIRRYLHSVHCDLEQTKKLIEHSYTLRGKYPNIFYNRDPLDHDVQKIFNVA